MKLWWHYGQGYRSCVLSSLLKTPVETLDNIFVGFLLAFMTGIYTVRVRFALCTLKCLLWTAEQWETLTPESVPQQTLHCSCCLTSLLYKKKTKKKTIKKKPNRITLVWPPSATSGNTPSPFQPWTQQLESCEGSSLSRGSLLNPVFQLAHPVQNPVCSCSCSSGAAWVGQNQLALK